MLKWKDGMTQEQTVELLAECQRLDDLYAEADKFDAANAQLAECDEDYEVFDPVRDGWVDKNTGRP
jgi:hypothetical protein